MKRGDLVTVAISGDFGKPRPALVIQADQFSDAATTTVLLISATLVGAPLIRVPIEPSPEDGLRKPSQVMVDKAMTVKNEKMSSPFGRLDDADMVVVDRCLALFLGYA